MEPLELENVRIGRRLRELALVKPRSGSRHHGPIIERGPADWPYRRRLPTGAPDSPPHVIGVGRYVGPTGTWVTLRQAASLPAWHIEEPRPRGRQRLVATACGKVWGMSMMTA